MPRNPLPIDLLARISTAEALRLVEACPEGVSWALLQGNVAEAWEAYPRPEGLLWALEADGRTDPVKSRLFACWCVRHTRLPDGRTVWDLLTDARSREAVETAEKFALGQANDEELAAARERASWVATATWTAQTPEAAAAAAAAAWAAAADAGGPKSDVARAVESAAAAAGGGEQVQRAQADGLRALYGNPYAAVAQMAGRQLVTQAGS